MDIRKWLDGIVPAETPAGLQTAPIAESPARPNGRENVSKKQHMPKRSRTDSSLLEALPPRRRTTTRPRKLPSEGGTDESARSEDPGHVHGEPSRFRTSSERYARRPRRKTRPGRYEPSAKVAGERGKHVHRSRKDELKQTQRKTKRKKEDRLGSGMGPDFHAKNVTGDRLTLKPREQWGLFNKGRTSTAIKGRGLPDLVFSEMRFLQKHEEQSSLPPRPEVTKRRRKKDHVHLKEREISAYFTTMRPALVEKDQNLPEHRRTHVKESFPIPSQQQQGRHPLTGAAVPTIEACDKASYLGFGSRGPRHESTSYVTWSESGRAHSITPARLPNWSSTREHQVRSPGRNHNIGSIDVRQDSSIQGAPPTTSRLEGSPLLKRLKASSPDPSRRPVSRSQSFPQGTSSPRRMNAINRTVKFQQVDNSGSPSSMPPSLPAHVELKGARPKHVDNRGKETPVSTYVPCTKQNSIYGQRRTESAEEDVSEMAPSTDSDLDRTIQQCNETFQQRSRPTLAHHTDPEPCELSHSAPRAGRHANLELDATTQQAPKVRFAGTHSRRLALANVAGPGIYEQQIHHERFPQSHLDEHVLEAYRLEDGHLAHDHNMVLEEQSWEEGPDETFAYGHGVDGVGTGMYGGDDGLESETLVRHLASGDSVVAAGFWRPNRLY